MGRFPRGGSSPLRRIGESPLLRAFFVLPCIPLASFGGAEESPTLIGAPHEEPPPTRCRQASGLPGPRAIPRRQRPPLGSPGRRDGRWSGRARGCRRRHSRGRRRVDPRTPAPSCLSRNRALVDASPSARRAPSAAVSGLRLAPDGDDRTARGEYAADAAIVNAPSAVRSRPSPWSAGAARGSREPRTSRLCRAPPRDCAVRPKRKRRRILLDGPRYEGSRQHDPTSPLTDGRLATAAGRCAARRRARPTPAPAPAAAPSNASVPPGRHRGDHAAAAARPHAAKDHAPCAARYRRPGRPGQPAVAVLRPGSSRAEASSDRAGQPSPCGGQAARSARCAERDRLAAGTSAPSRP